MDNTLSTPAEAHPAGTAAAYQPEGRNKKERHWGLVPSYPNVGYSDSCLTRKMADFHTNSKMEHNFQPHKRPDGSLVHAKRAVECLGGQAYPSSSFTESAEYDYGKRRPRHERGDWNGTFHQSTVPNRAELTHHPRDLWSRGSEASVETAMGMPAKSSMRPQDHVMGGKAGLGRKVKEEFKDRARAPYACHVTEEHDSTNLWNQ